MTPKGINTKVGHGFNTNPSERAPDIQRAKWARGRFNRCTCLYVCDRKSWVEDLWQSHSELQEFISFRFYFLHFVIPSLYTMYQSKSLSHATLSTFVKMTPPIHSPQRGWHTVIMVVNEIISLQKSSINTLCTLNDHIISTSEFMT